MIRGKTVGCLLIGMVVFVSATKAAGETLYAANGRGGAAANLYVVDKATGAAALIGPIGHPVDAMAWDATEGKLYAINETNLVLVNPASGAGTVVGAHGLAGHCPGLGFTTGGQLYAWARRGGDDLAAVDKTTGVGTRIPVSMNTTSTGMGIDLNNVSWLWPDPQEGWLYNVDLVTGAPTFAVHVDEMPWWTAALKGICFDEDNTFYCVRFTSGCLATVDVETGHIEDVGGFGVGNMCALAFAIELAEDDLCVTSIDAPVSAAGLTDETVTVTVENRGLNDQTDFDVEYTVELLGATVATVTETYAGTLAAGDSDSFSFTATVDMSTVGYYTVTARTVLSSDGKPENDASSATVVHVPTISTFPYVETFESDAGYWVSGGTGDSWEYGEPAKGITTGAASGTGAWTNGGLHGRYNGAEQSELLSPFFDMSGLTAPEISLAIAWDAQWSVDGAVLQSSIDGGTTWVNVGAMSDPTNWFNDSTITGAPGGQQVGWSGYSKGWVIAKHALTGLGGEASVRLRVAFGSDSNWSWASLFEGVAIDDVVIRDSVAGLHVREEAGEAPMDALAAGTVAVADLLMDAVASGESVTDVTVSLTGTLGASYITGAALWEDDGDGVFDSGADTSLATLADPFAAGPATFSGAILTITADTTSRVFLSYDVDVTAPAGATFGAELAPATDIVVASADPVTSVPGTVTTHLRTVWGKVSTLPWADDFDGVTPANRTTDYQAGGTFPTATAAGAAVGTSAATGNDASVALVGGVPRFGGAPQSPPLMASISYPNGQATGAIDYRFDLAAYDAATDALVLNFKWLNAYDQNNDEDNVFVSVDGGATWAASVCRFYYAQYPAWTPVSLGLSKALTDAAVNYTDDVVIRFQAADNEVFGRDGILIDDVELGLGPRAVVERIAGTPIASGSTDDLGNATVGRRTVTYTVKSEGGFDLVYSSLTLAASNLVNVSNVTFAPQAQHVLAPGESDSFAVELTVDAVGAFSLDVSFFANDPMLPDGRFTVTLSGTGVAPSGDDGKCGAGGAPAIFAAFALIAALVSRRRRG